MDIRADVRVEYTYYGQLDQGVHLNCDLLSFWAIFAYHPFNPFRSAICSHLTNFPATLNQFNR